MSDYVVVDIPKFGRGQRSGKYDQLEKDLRALPEGKALELPIPENENHNYFGSKVAQAFRGNRHRPSIQYSVDPKRRVLRIWLRKNGNGA